MDQLQQPLPQLVAILRVLKAQGPQPHLAVIHPMAIKMDNLVGVIFGPGPLQRRRHRRKGGRLQNIHLHQL